MTSPDGKDVERLSIGLDRKTLAMLDRALRVRYGQDYSLLSSFARGNFLRLAIWAYCSAIVKRGAGYNMAMLACDVRRETQEETVARVGKAIPAPKPGGPAAVPIKVEWMPQECPGRWN